MDPFQYSAPFRVLANIIRQLSLRICLSLLLFHLNIPQIVAIPTHHYVYIYHSVFTITLVVYSILITFISKHLQVFNHKPQICNSQSLLSLPLWPPLCPHKPLLIFLLALYVPDIRESKVFLVGTVSLTSVVIGFPSRCCHRYHRMRH
jgi:hypothetical protein